MKTRREVIKFLLALFAVAATFFGRILTDIHLAIAETRKRLLKKGTPLDSLIGQDPSDLDASDLEITPLEEFGTMGQTNYSVSPENWRLTITGTVATPLKMAYDEIVGKPSIERDVLLICPGFFAYHGRWKGVSVVDLLDAVGVLPGATQIEFSGPKGVRGRTERFPLDEIHSHKVFLAYQVNGRPLPKRHGYPLRVVAEDSYGSRWVKYVDKITIS